MTKFIFCLFTILWTSIIQASSVAKYTDTIGGVDLHVSTASSYIFDKTNINSQHVNKNVGYFEILTKGLYQISYNINWQTTDINKHQVLTYIMKNGIDIIDGSYGYARQENQAGNATNSATFFVQLESADQIAIKYQTDSTENGTATTNSQQSTVSIHYIEEVVDNISFIGKSCQDILLNNATVSDGVYTIDPDGITGDEQPFEAYCDMNTQGGGWHLVGIKAMGIQSTVTNTLTDLTIDEGVESDILWSKHKLSSDEMLVVGTNDTWAVLDMQMLKIANCTPLADSLTSMLIAHAETSGCTGTGLDYSILGWDLAYATSVYDYSSTIFIKEFGGSGWLFDASSSIATNAPKLFTNAPKLFIYVR